MITHATHMQQKSHVVMGFLVLEQIVLVVLGVVDVVLALPGEAGIRHR